MKTSLLILCASAVLFSACSKNDDSGQNPPATTDSFMNASVGSTWTYHEVNSSGGTPQASDYTVTSSGRDSMIGSRSYHAYDYSYGGSQYLNRSGHDYYQFDSIPGSADIGGVAVERLYLKDNLNKGDTWSQDFNFSLSGIPFPVPVKLTNTVVDKGLSRTVGAQTYTGVFHISSSISTSYIPSDNLSSAIDSYYAPGYGLIENSTQVSLNYLTISETVDIETQLTGAVLK
jgi:hypothetical protein